MPVPLVPNVPDVPLVPSGEELQREFKDNLLTNTLANISPKIPIYCPLSYKLNCVVAVRLLRALH